MALFDIQDVHKTYTSGKSIETPALNGVSFEIEARDFLAIAGPSGSGKSTLLHLLGALDTPTSGTILFDNSDISAQTTDKLSTTRLQKIGFVFQAYNLINTLSALENVEYIMLLQGVHHEIRRARALETLKRVGLTEYVHRYPNEMSGGQQQRVAVARAIAGRPKVILADEPTANLDSRTAESLLSLMQELNDEHGTTFIFSTHDKMIMDKARKLIRIKDGRIEP